MTEAGAMPTSEGRESNVHLVELLLLGAGLLMCSTATWSLALAQLGRHNGGVAILLGTVTAVVLALGAVRLAGRPRVVVGWSSLALAAGAVLVALAMFAPGSPYAMGDKDPGIYVAHGFAIAREGDVTLHNEVLDRMDEVETFSPGALFPGLWIDDSDPTAITPQFFHLYPALLGTVIDLVGAPGAWNLNPLLAALSVAGLALSLRRAVGVTAAVVVAVLLSLSMPQVWQAKYPSTEVLAQLLLSLTVLGGVIALRSRWLPAAGAAGVAVTVGFLARPDGVLYVLLGVVLLGGLLAVRRWDARATWFAAGLAIPLPYALWNAYDLRVGYTLANGVPPLNRVAAGSALVLALGAAVGHLLRDRDLAPSDRLMRRLGLLGSALFAAVLLLAWYRRDLTGIDYTYFGPERIRSHDEENLRWLALFFTVPGIAAVWGGVTVTLVRRWQPALLLVLAPGLALLPLYLWEAKISPRMLWWVRRYVPGVIPAMVAAIAVLIGWALMHRWRPVKAGGAALALYLGAVWAGQSLPLRDHREMGGSFTVGEEIASARGDEPALFIFVRPRSVHDPNRNFPGPVWLIHDELTAMLPPEPDGDDLDRYRAAFPDRELLLVTSYGDDPPASLGATFEEVHRYETVLPFWDESVVERPDHDQGWPILVTVWRLTEG